MPLPTDPETLKIPAFMRKRSLASRQRRPLILTALDRKRAGLPPEGLRKKEKVARKKIARKISKKTVYAQEFPFFDSTQFIAAKKKKIAPTQCKVSEKKKNTLRKKIIRKRKTQSKRALRYPEPEIFSPPIIDTPAANIRTPVGTITRYYDKIKVGVIDVSTTISVGDCISYKTANGEDYEQIIESMEINRQPVFSAGKGDDIGLKLQKNPLIGCKVYRI